MGKGEIAHNRNVDEKQKKEMIKEEDRILRQTDKTFVLCIDPETSLPFQVNMGLNLAEFFNLDNRPEGKLKFD